MAGRRVRDFHRDERGQALLLALIALAVGMLLVVPFLTHAGTNLMASRGYAEELRLNYSADAGVEYGIWHLQQGETTVPQFTINGDTVDVTITDIGNGRYRIVSRAERAGESITIDAVVEVSSGGGGGLFSYAVTTLDGDIRLDADGRVYSDDYPALNAPVFAHGSVEVNNQAIIDGDAYATDTISVATQAAVNGVQYPASDALDLTAQLAALDADVASWQAETLAHGCGTVDCGSYTYTGNTYSPPSGTYTDPVNARRNMSLTDWGGSWTFQDTVCVGVDTARNLTISNGTTTFEGPVSVGGNLNISGWSTTVTFMDRVCIGRDLTIADGTVVVFQGPVSVGDDATFGGWGGSITCGDTVYVTGQLVLEEGKSISLGGTVYAVDSVSVADQAVITGGRTIISDGNISVEGSGSSLNEDVVAAADIPYLVSTGGAVTFDEAAGAVALVYAPAGEVQLRGYANSVVGAVVAESFRMLNWGPNTLMFPADLGADTGSAGGGDGLTVLSWDVYP